MPSQASGSTGDSRHAADPVGDDDDGGERIAPHLRRLEAGPGDDHRDAAWPHFIKGVLRDARFQITETSESLEGLLGGPGDTLLGAQPWTRFIAPAEVAHVEELLAKTAAGESWSDRLRVVTADGDPAVFDVHANTRLLPDGSSEVRISMRNISELATALTVLSERDARLRMLTAELPVILWTCDHDLRITWLSVSPLVPDHPPEDSLIDRPVHDLFGTAANDSPGVAEKAALRGERAAYEVAARGHRFRCSVEPKFDLFGRIIGTIGTAVSLPGSVPENSPAGAENLPRRVPLETEPGGDAEPIRLGELSIDPEKFVVTKSGQELPLTVTEFKLLMEFASNASRVLPREDLVRSVWGYDFAGSTGMVTMAVKRLRAKIEEDPAAPRIIETVRGVGYRVHKSALRRTDHPISE